MTGRKTTFADAADIGWGGRKRATVEADLDITPMIDVTFLLLIFFMVTSTMQTPDLDVPAAKHGVGVDSSGAIILQIKSGSPSPTIFLDDKTEGTLEEVRARVEAAVRGARGAAEEVLEVRQR